MKAEILGIPGPIALKPKTFQDGRGFFRELYQKDKFSEWSVEEDWVQVNNSYSKFGTLRGLHYRDGEAKLVTVLSGEINDVFVDIRPGSDSFGRWGKIKMIAGYQVYIPSGFAHGFEVLSKDGAEIVYLTTKVYDPKQAKGIAWNDPQLQISWETYNPYLSDKDKENESWASYVGSINSGS